MEGYIILIVAQGKNPGVLFDLLSPDTNSVVSTFKIYSESGHLSPSPLPLSWLQPPRYHVCLSAMSAWPVSLFQYWPTVSFYTAVKVILIKHNSKHHCSAQPFSVVTISFGRATMSDMTGKALHKLNIFLLFLSLLTLLQLWLPPS